MSKKEIYDIRKKEKERRRARLAYQKKLRKIIGGGLIILLVGGGLTLGLKYSARKPRVGSTLDNSKITVFYSPTCSCCGQYISYLKRKGLEVIKKEDMRKRIDILDKHQISQNMESCHTSIVGDYFVEGHVPFEIIKKLLEEKPEIDGIALPGMPNGSPGMPGFKTEKWTIYGFSNGESFKWTEL